MYIFTDYFCRLYSFIWIYFYTFSGSHWFPFISVHYKNLLADLIVHIKNGKTKYIKISKTQQHGFKTNSYRRHTSWPWGRLIFWFDWFFLGESIPFLNKDAYLYIRSLLSVFHWCKIQIMLFNLVVYYLISTFRLTCMRIWNFIEITT